MISPPATPIGPHQPSKLPLSNSQQLTNCSPAFPPQSGDSTRSKDAFLFVSRIAGHGARITGRLLPRPIPNVQRANALHFASLLPYLVSSLLRFFVVPPISFPCHTSEKSAHKSKYCHTSENPLPQVLCLPHIQDPPGGSIGVFSQDLNLKEESPAQLHRFFASSLITGNRIQALYFHTLAHSFSQR